MIPQFEGLNSDEQQLLMDTVPMITILIAGADGDIDTKEKEWANKLMEIRSYAHPESLQDYYTAVGKDYASKLEGMISSLPSNVKERNEVISEKLAKLNDVLPKLETNLSARLYKSFTTFAEHVAKASGGFLGFATVSKEEAKLIELPMITPITMEETEETEEGGEES